MLTQSNVISKCKHTGLLAERGRDAGSPMRGIQEGFTQVGRAEWQLRLCPQGAVGTSSNFLFSFPTEKATGIKPAHRLQSPQLSQLEAPYHQ
eukprot:790083-Pelagomonas_calceolata.AAC.2